MDIKAENVKIGDTLTLWNGKKIVSKIKQYKGNFDFILNILVFSDDTTMSNEKGAIYNGQSRYESSWQEVEDDENELYMRGCRGVDY